jgi:tagatose 1,6-diphosphate aldolase
MSLSAGKYWGLRRLADAAGRFKMVAVDQRPPIKNPIKAKRGLPEAPWEDVAGFKEMLVRELQGEASALLLDPHYAYPRGVELVDPRRGLILTLEDSIFVETPGGRRSSEIDAWSVEKIKRAGGDAVKVLAWYRPDADEETVRHQKAFVRRVGEACAHYDIPYVFELLVYPFPHETEGGSDYVEMRAKHPELVCASVEEFARPEYGVDLFKLESPVPASEAPGVGAPGWQAAQAHFDRLDRAAGRPWVMLSAGASAPAFAKVLSHAYKAGASGYLAGRAIWAEAFQRFPDWDGVAQGLRGQALGYMQEINALTDQGATPWTAHRAFANGARREPRDATFRQVYKGFGG